MTASNVEQTKLITLRQYEEIPYEPGYWIKKTVYRAAAITTKK